MDRVFITSFAPVTPIGTGAEAFFQSIAADQSGIGPIQNFDTSLFPLGVGAEARDEAGVIENQSGLDRKEIFLGKALLDIAAKSPFNNYQDAEKMLLLGMGIDYLRLQELCESDDAEKHRWVPYSVNTQRMAMRLAHRFGLHGGVRVNVSACVASSQAMGLAFRLLKNGTRRLMVAGGVDSMLNPLHYIGFYKLGALAPDTCKPCDINRRGLVLGEGASLFTFESAVRANPDNILAEVCGYGASMDAYMITDPLPDGAMLAHAAELAIKEAGMTPGDIDCVHLHGTGTQKNDVMECHALQRIFGDRYQDIPVFSMKSRVGHMISACGAAEFGGCLYSFARQEVPATLNFENKDPDVPLNVLRKSTTMKINAILKLNAAFGGQNTAFVLKRYEH